MKSVNIRNKLCVTKLPLHCSWGCCRKIYVVNDFKPNTMDIEVLNSSLLWTNSKLFIKLNIEAWESITYFQCLGFINRVSILLLDPLETVLEIRKSVKMIIVTWPDQHQVSHLKICVPSIDQDEDDFCLIQTNLSMPGPRSESCLAIISIRTMRSLKQMMLRRWKWEVMTINLTWCRNAGYNSLKRRHPRLVCVLSWRLS